MPPAYEINDGADLVLTIPAANLDMEPVTRKVAVSSAGQPVPGAQVLAIYPNNSFVEAGTGDDGVATLELHSSRMPMTVYVAKEGFRASVMEGWIPADRNLAVEAERLEGGGSTIFTEGDGEIPGLVGRLETMMGAHGRASMHARRITVDEGREQPVSLVFGEDYSLVDNEGSKRKVRVVHMKGIGSILEYRKVG